MASSLSELNFSNSSVLTSAQIESVPLCYALALSTRYALSTMLNTKKVIPTKTGKLRDWRGVAEDLGFTNNEINIFYRQEDPFSQVLQKANSKVTWEKFKMILEDLDRYDILDDHTEAIERDIQNYQSRVTSRENIIETVSSLKCLTVGDTERVRNNKELELFDALLLYVEKDAEFAEKVRSKMEDEFNLKLCLETRDVLPGLPQISALQQLIESRCRRTLIIISEALLESNLYSHLTSYTQALNVYERKIIPIVYYMIPNDKFPTSLRFYHCWNFTRQSTTWDALANSIKPTPSSPSRKISFVSGSTDSSQKQSKSVLSKLGIRNSREEELNTDMKLSLMGNTESSSDTVGDSGYLEENDSSKFISKKITSFKKFFTKKKISLPG